MNVLEQGSPGWILVKDGMGESDQTALVLGQDRAGTRIAEPEPVGPHRQPVVEDVAVKEGIGICATVVTAPAVGMQR